MGIKRRIVGAVRSLRAAPYTVVDRLFLPKDRAHVRRTRNIRRIPHEPSRRGGKYAYGEWAHVIGIFQTLMYLHLEKKVGNRIMDIGCGTGLLGIASEPFLAEGGRYTGIDVMPEDVAFCRRHYPEITHEFVHLDVANAMYAPTQERASVPWPVADGQFDMLTALSVWTHFNETDATFYLEEVQRVLKPGGKAIITFFVLDEVYEASLSTRTSQEGRFHSTNQSEWIFDQPTYGSDAWRHPKQFDHCPESAIGVTPEGLQRLLAASQLKLVEHHHGNWKEVPGLFFQDVLVFQKA